MTARPRVMTLAVEAARLAGEVRGIGRYVHALLPRLVASRPGLRLVLFVKPRDAATMRTALQACDALRGRVEVRSERELHRARADVCWYPWNIARPAPPAGSAVVVTVHDVAPLAFAGEHWRDWRSNRRWRRKYRDTADRATLVVADSAFTADEVHRLLGVSRARIRVIPLAADAPPAPHARDAELVRGLGVHPPFALAVGADDERKNLAVLDAAMPLAVASVPSLSLVLAGPRRAGTGADAEPWWKRTLGYVSEAQLAALYRAATCVVVPSTYEGFGLPVLEAMRHGAPVVCARTSSLPEVGGGAVEWVAPGDAAGFAAAITRLARDPGARETLRRAGTARAALFSWDDTARHTLAAFDEAMLLAPGRPAVPRRGLRGALVGLLPGARRASSG